MQNKNMRDKLAGIININGHNIVVSEITSFVNVGGDKFRIFFKNGVEKEYNVKEVEVPILESNIIDAIVYNKHPWNGGTRVMPDFDSFSRPHDIYNPHINRPSSAPNFGRTYNDRYDNGFRNFTDVRDNGVNNFGNVPNSNWLADPLVDTTLRDGILHFIFVSDETHGIRVPTFVEITTSLDFKEDWQLSSEYAGNDYVSILAIINNKINEFKILLNKISNLGVTR